ncbi:hypothetical protein J4G37_22115 [Microvirga sp. 3-52]|nr:hypothetical protein [Microvirga sp. 3-52]
MSVIGLNLPTDVLWERVCVTEDMIDPKACDSNTPPKWQTSAALYKYIPADEYQLYEGRTIIYYKLVATIGSYQPEDKEIEGRINWRKVHPQDIADFQERLKSYLPCHGAMVQITATPPDTEGVALSDYPYFLDCQPKQRALYEQATDFAERVSRSLESINVKKGAGSTDSLEVLDVDEGVAVGGNVSVFGTGAGFNYAEKGQHGSKRLGQTESTNVRTTDSAREARDTLSHTTQITQMYNLLQAYHLGTNRLMFYLTPRPHVLEEPSGFIRGPRRIDGIQEFFLIVSRLKDQGDPCIGIRIDTAHLTLEPVYDFDRSLRPEELRIDLSAPPPEEGAPDKIAVDGGGPFHDCFDLRKSDTKTTTAQSGYIIEEEFIEVLQNDAKNSAGGSYELSPDKRSITVRGECFGHRCYRNTAGDAANAAALAAAGGKVGGPLGALGGAILGATGTDAPGFPETKEDSPGFLKYMIRVPFRSELQTKWVRDEWVLKVTSRGLCCCERKWWDKMIAVQAFPIDHLIGERRHEGDRKFSVEGHYFTPREINLVQEKIAEMAQRVSAAIARPQEIEGVDRAYILSKLLRGAAGTRNRDRQLRRSLDEEIAGRRLNAGILAEYFGTDSRMLKVHHVAQAPDDLLRRAAGIERDEDLLSLRLSVLGFPTLDEPGSESSN